MNFQEVYDELKGSSQIRLDELILYADIPSGYLPPNTVESATRAMRLIEWAQQSPENQDALASALNRVQGSGVIRLSADWKPPSTFALLFDRQSHEELVAETLRDAADRAHGVVTFLLPGSPDESPVDFVERCVKFIQPKALLKVHLPPIVDYYPLLEWPSVRLSHDKRIARLREGLAGLIGGSATALDDAGLRAAVTDWMARERKHKVIQYQLFITHVSPRDGSLIKYLAEFWRKVELPPAQYGITIFICIHFRRFRLWRYLGSSACCIRQAKKAFAGAPDFVIMDHLEAPHRDDVEPWADSKCDSAWRFLNDLGLAADHKAPLPLHGGELKRSAKAAFGRRRSMPFLYLKSGLEEAIEKSHEKFLKSRGSR